MKTLIKLLIAVVIVNAVFRCGSVALKYYQFKDQVQQMVLFGQGETAPQLTDEILEEAQKRSVPLDDEGLTVSRQGARTVADVSYSENVEVFPRYFYPVTFSFSAEAFGVAGASPGTRRR
jgi:type III secretion system FlhB-like substrate exporter